MLFQGLAILLLACAATGQQSFYEGACPPENSAVAAFRNLTDVRAPLYIPLIDRVLKDASSAQDEIKAKLAEVDLPWKFSLPTNDSNSRLRFAPFLDRCCEDNHHACSNVDIILSYLKFDGGVCWVVWPEHFFIYKRCTCCACLLLEDAPVVGRCVETDYQTVGVIAYCPHIKYQKVALRIPTRCRCQAACPTPLDYVLPDNSPAQERRLQIASTNIHQQSDQYQRAPIVNVVSGI
ncbi:uncharacterized protein [Littorina saxatilis]|uniref:Uncharacterized protein n=1 Tax=Littorina saxatilis TaxID=31220 RepID=A0AAN9AUZ4_9CAEN